MNPNYKHAASDDSAGRGPIYVEASGRAHLLVDLSPSDYRVLEEDDGTVRQASKKEANEYVFRRFDMPRIFEELSGTPIKFANPEHRRFEGKRAEPLLPSEIPHKVAEFETILGDIRDTEWLHFIFMRIIPDVRKVMKAGSSPIEWVRDALCHRDPKTGSTLVSALYRFSYFPLGRKLRDFAFSVWIAPYDAREMAAAKIEGYCRHFRDVSLERSYYFNRIQELCDLVSRWAYADVPWNFSDTIFSMLTVQLGNRLNFDWAARALDVLLNELIDVYDAKTDPIDPFQRDNYWMWIDERILNSATDDRFAKFASAMFLRMKSHFSETARSGRATSHSSVPPPDVNGIRAKVERGYSDAFFWNFEKRR